ncbi:protein phosphatase 1 regulatory subunit 21-like isoform X2 [Portunus trituberculatus]|uniref:protein phosphatase 1 regulatory subunit 21-like isoform X2 n=1 Tax=Portunus trituberculatus TaxID=210409 RepID=UPI001E1CBEE9|nr:protein phosphatase 1 regulatory subunit 21-like isoform X2 [Portunus trituberculatus]
MESPDLHAKYQKLATEYSKDSMKSRDQLLRKAEQENDSLSFRNQQLTKRLTLLQQDLDEIQLKNKRGRGKAESVVDGMVADTEVFTEELHSKIQENARLQSELADSQTTYRKRLSEFETQLEAAKRESQKYKEMLQLRERSTNDMVDQLEGERVRQEVVAQQREAELRMLKEQVAKLQEKLSINTSSTTAVAAAATAVAASTCLSQGDTHDTVHHRIGKSPGSSSLNISVQNGREKSPSYTARSLVDTYDSLIQDMSKSFAKFLCSYSTRVKYHHQQSEVQQKLVEHLKSAAFPWHSLAASYHQLTETASMEGFVALETLTGLSHVSQQVNACVASLRKVLPLVVHWICEGSQGVANADRTSASWSAAFSRLVSSWGSLTPYVATLANQSTPNSILPKNAQGRIISMLSDRLSNFHAALKEATSACQKKAESEKELSLLSSDAKVASEEMVSALTSLTSVTGKMSSIFKEQVVSSWNRAGSTPSTPSSPYPSMPHSLSKSGTPLCGVQDDGSSALYDSTLVSPSDSTTLGDTEVSLMKQLALASSKLTQLEAEREHWRLEHQLLQCKHQKEAKRVRELESQLKGESVSSKEDGGHKDHSASVTSAISVIGEVQGCDGALDEREKDIRNHFTNRCSHLYMQLTSATSQAALYQNECESLMRHLAVSNETKTASEQEMDKHRERVNHLKEVLQTTSRNYEEQISTMSEHLADLNEKLTAQSELIEHLKFEAKSKKSKK